MTSSKLIKHQRAPDGYWENKGNSPVTITLKIEGSFELIGIK